MRHFDLSGFNSVIRMKMLTAVLYITNCFLSQSQKIMENLHAAESWIRENMSLFQGHVDLPPILSMTEEDRQQVLQNRVNGDDEARDGFMFMFELQEDHDVFLDHCKASGINVNTGFHTSCYDTGSPDSQEAQ